MNKNCILKKEHWYWLITMYCTDKLCIPMWALEVFLFGYLLNTASNNQTNGDALAVTDPVVYGIDVIVFPLGLNSKALTPCLPSTASLLPIFPLSWFTLIRHAKWVFTVGEASARGAGRHQSIGEKSFLLISLSPVSTFSSFSGSCSRPLCPGSARSEFTRTFPRWAAFTPCQCH